MFKNATRIWSDFQNWRWKHAHDVFNESPVAILSVAPQSEEKYRRTAMLSSISFCCKNQLQYIYSTARPDDIPKSTPDVVAISLFKPVLMSGA